MRFSVLASSSRANCTFIEAGGTRILIDCGLSAKQTALRLAETGIDADSLDAILVTHEHRDHIAGISVMSRRHRLPVFANAATAEFLEDVYGLEHFATGKSFEFKGLKISPFQTAHDAADPVGFVINSEGLKFAHVTDLGKVTPLVRDAVRLANAMVLEFNHDQQLLWACHYPWVLKQRIASTHGHLSNSAAAELVKEMLHSEFFHLVLGHISENSNTPDSALRSLQSEVALDCFLSCLCASHYQSTPLREVEERGQKIAI